MDTTGYREIFQDILAERIKTKDQLQKAKIEYCKKNGIKRLPRDADILSHAPPQVYERVKPLLRIKSMRTASGVAIVAVMTIPHQCPHGKCIYCPGGVEYDTPQSYTGKEPAALRAVQHNFDPYNQTRARLEQLERIGHPIDKVDLIIMGGTFTSLDHWYQEWFVKRCFDAMNKTIAKDLAGAHHLNENAQSRCIGLTIETRPDWFLGEHVDRALGLGATRVELGVQILDDEILRRVKRGHSVKETIDATRIAKDAGMKIGYHMMPGLPGSTFEKDLKSFKQIFQDHRFKPDMLKIYPVLVIDGTELYELQKRGEYKPYSTHEAARLIAGIKKIVPRWVRIQRIQRDIPSYLIQDGVKKSHLRQLVRNEMERRGDKCYCIRCREIGHKPSCTKVSQGDIELFREEYNASGGKEIFLSFETRDREVLIGYARLRRPSKKARKKEIKDCSGIIRELRVLGQIVPIHDKTEIDWQHKGYGKTLVKECEEIVKREWSGKKILVTSGIGARNYYKKFGYKKVGVYMGKKL